MPTYLLRWNPAEWPKDKFTEFFQGFERGEPLRWSCGSTKKIAPGDRIYLVKSGQEGRGIIGSGTVIEAPHLDIHFKADRAARGEQGMFVGVRFDYLTKPGAYPPIGSHELDGKGLASSVWDTQGTGKLIPEDVAVEVDKLWRARVPVAQFSAADELDAETLPLLEGAKRQVWVNAYERHPDARRRCLNKWGLNCAVCNFRFDRAYGPLGKGFMHVHHLTSLASIGEEYQLDPERDLRPVCPNCHAMLHRRKPPLSIEELQGIVATYQSVA